MKRLLEYLRLFQTTPLSSIYLSILECILVDARETEIKLMANDMELGIETIIEGETPSIILFFRRK